MDVFGSFIPDQVRQNIEGAESFFGDITERNQNVYYELGYAVGLRKPIFPIVNASFSGATDLVRREGLFDNIGYQTYENSQELAQIFQSASSSPLLNLYEKDFSTSQSIFFLDTLRKTEFRNAIVSAIKASKIHYRSHDPSEQARIAAVQLIGEITASAAVILPYLAKNVDDSENHNLRAAFIAGLTHGLGRPLYIVGRENHDLARPADYKDDIKYFKDNSFTDEIEEFCKDSYVNSQSIVAFSNPIARVGLQKISLGASYAENEFRSLKTYFVETSEYLRASRGEVSIITGRKGAGKSAIFFQVRDTFRATRNAVVVDLKPDSHQLSLFREQFQDRLSVGMFDHTIAAFWYFVILSETLLSLSKVLELKARTDEAALNSLYKVEQTLNSYGIEDTGDFTSRLTKLGSAISRDIINRGNLTPDAVTNIVFKKGISELRRFIVDTIGQNDQIFFLFDNIDKGWPATGIEKFDAKMVRILLESLEKCKRDIQSDGRKFSSIVFLRHDIYEMVVEQTPDRGKYAQIAIDWTDRAKLKQLILKRLAISSDNTDQNFETIWSKYFCDNINGLDSFEYALDNCLMRPRFLINIIEGAIANAINRRHAVVADADFIDSVKSHSETLIDDFGYEIRDVSGLSHEMLYALVGAKQRASSQYYIDRFVKDGSSLDEAERAFDLMIWYGLLGIVDRSNADRFVYDYQYNTKRLNAEAREATDGPVYVVNPGLFSGLSS